MTRPVCHFGIDFGDAVVEIKQRPVPQAFYSEQYPEVLTRIFAARGITDEEELDKRMQALLPFDSLKDVDKACDRLYHALVNQEHLLIVGDFDADGATSTALAVAALRLFGAAMVSFLVPNRFEYGYGLTPDIVNVAYEQKPNVLITVDNGISSIEGVERANVLGIDVIVTDHHLPGDVLPDAFAIVNPNQEGCIFSSKSIAGVGVIFYVMLRLRRYLSDKNWFEETSIPVPNMAQFLDLVALGTVADVVSLDKNNRILVNQGLMRMRDGKARIGIQALATVSGKDLSRIKESDLGFSLAPRLNAAGRLDDMSLGITCLLSTNPEEAAALASELDALNIERRMIEQDMKRQAFLALDKIQNSVADGRELPVALCLSDDWHQGVIGILAGRLKERYHRPVIIFSEVDDGILKGSARSVHGVNIRDILASVNVQFPHIIQKFGGHAMAAGLTISQEHFNEFSKHFIHEVGKHLTLDACQGVVLTDGSLNSSDFSLSFAKLLESSGPWGQQFPEPLFDNVFDVIDQRLVGQNHLKLSLALPGTVDIFDAIMFNIDTSCWPNHRVHQVHAAYKLDINVFQRRERLQLMIQAMNVVNKE